MNYGEPPPPPEPESEYIYVAGLLSRNHKGEVAFAIEYLENIADFIDCSLEVMHRGHTPFCPSIDFMFFIVNKAQGRPEIGEKMIKAYSLNWLRRCDAILLMPGWEMSPGTRAELAEAVKLGLKVYHDVSEVPDLRDGGVA